MRLNLSNYQIQAPYPALRNIQPDKGLADELLQGYSGERSELTTILQYAYHSLNCRNIANEFSNMIQGIFYVETLHMNFLGNCIKNLGGDVEYVIPLNEKNVSWQASMVNYMDTPAQMLLTDIQGEKFAAKFYQEMAAQSPQTCVTDLLNRLAEDEKLHVNMLEKLYERMFS